MEPGHACTVVLCSLSLSLSFFLSHSLRELQLAGLTGHIFQSSGKLAIFSYKHLVGSFAFVLDKILHRKAKLASKMLHFLPSSGVMVWFMVMNLILALLLHAGIKLNPSPNSWPALDMHAWTAQITHSAQLQFDSLTAAHLTNLNHGQTAQLPTGPPLTIPRVTLAFLRLSLISPPLIRQGPPLISLNLFLISQRLFH